MRGFVRKSGEGCLNLAGWICRTTAHKCALFHTACHLNNSIRARGNMEKSESRHLAVLTQCWSSFGCSALVRNGFLPGCALCRWGSLNHIIGWQSENRSRVVPFLNKDRCRCVIMSGIGTVVIVHVSSIVLFSDADFVARSVTSNWSSG